MKRKLNWLLGCTLLCGLAASDAFAQKGVGESEGIAQQAVKPTVVPLSGTVKGIVVEKCENTTGPSTTGAHVLMTTDEGNELNIHLGPAVTVRYATDQLIVGQEVTANAFRTDKLPENNFVAQSLTIDGKSIDLRDENLRPLWARGGRAMRGSERGRNGSAWGGRRGYGRGPGWGNGSGRRGPGWGRGQGRGNASGVGPGWGRRQQGGPWCRQSQWQQGGGVE